MKSAKEIVARSVILLCVSDRCALERPTIGGRTYSIKQREDQRLAINQWLKNKGYADMLTKDERTLFEQKVDGENKEEILSAQVQYEAIEPCLWTLGLTQKLSKYDQFVIDDFHPVLQIGLNHTVEKVLDASSIQTDEAILLQNEISMLWHWRTIEYNNPIFETSSVKDLVKSVFGNRYEKVLESIQQFDDYKNDFLVQNKSYFNLGIEDKKRIYYIAKWRHHAFEWIVGDEEWDEVELNT